MGIKRIEREDEPRRVSLEMMIRWTGDQARMLDLVENFTLFSEHKAGLVKIIVQNHQFLGVNNAIASMLVIWKRSAGLRPAAPSPGLDALDDPERTGEPDVLRLTEPRSSENTNGVGVFWHTQGSGKSYSMVSFAQKVLRKVAGNYAFVVVTDRVELDDQISMTILMSIGCSLKG